MLPSPNSDSPLHQQRSSTTPGYLPSQHLFDSSLTDDLAAFNFTSVAASQQQNDLTKSQANSLSETFIEISLYKKDDHKPALIEVADNVLQQILLK
ncbi:unnamed protein product [Rotaria sp. Silwood2]|nr:unnamed protein product [Rotaria sp. Silwood2]CAF3278755.1 unnamed protein product [Rotaria sp. Silwood2]CAF4325904.1 unnamed protein product [Rotaria sp. Silwood2]CAF4698027.1 unnamed protein product [Rotaria sp. Silwood2]